MNQYYLFNHNFREKSKLVTATVIFCPGLKIDVDQLQGELKEYYSKSFQTEKTILITGSYNDNLEEEIIKNKDKIFKYVPKIEEETFYENLHILVFNYLGDLKSFNHRNLNEFKGINSFKRHYLNEGLQKIFIERGGLVEATGFQHHFVFPSGKHSNKFLRVANTLLYSSEIYFIAFGLLKFFNQDLFREICCDTSSINSIAIALNDLVNRFKKSDERICYPVNSFNSYEGLYSGTVSLKSTSFILISASTSGGIVEYTKKMNPVLNKDNIVVLFF